MEIRSFTPAGAEQASPSPRQATASNNTSQRKCILCGAPDCCEAAFIPSLPAAPSSLLRSPCFLRSWPRNRSALFSSSTPALQCPALAQACSNAERVTAYARAICQGHLPFHKRPSMATPKCTGTGMLNTSHLPSHDLSCWLQLPCAHHPVRKERACLLFHAEACTRGKCSLDNKAIMHCNRYTILASAIKAFVLTKHHGDKICRAPDCKEKRRAKARCKCDLEYHYRGKQMADNQ